MSIGARIRAAREAEGLSLRALAIECGVPVATLSRAERDVGHVRATTIAAVSRALRVTTDHLILGAGQ